MKTFLTYLKDYFRTVALTAFFITFFFIAALVTMNYTVGIERRILAFGPWWLVLGGFFLFYGGVLALSWGLQIEWGVKGDSGRPGGTLTDGPAGGGDGGRLVKSRPLVILLLLAPLFFAAKMVHWDLAPLLPASYPWSRYWLIVLQLPAKLLLLLGMLVACRKAGWLEGDSLRESVGLTTKGFNARPYFLLLALLVPLIALASTQPDFLRFYPKVRNIAFINGYASPVWPWKLGYELSYGLDFLSIELFFRGLLVVGLVRMAGPQAILPMAAFYCTIHFGKPLGECISSFFGGLVLGVLAYRTRSILGGLIVHLGLAWMMEIGGWLGLALFHP
jgi:Type II CAAX prenyl endopeptidase Rce1-like